MNETIIGGTAGQRLVTKTEDGWWIVEERIGEHWEPTTGGWRRRSEAVAEAKRQVQP